MTIKLFGYEIALTITKAHNRRATDTHIEIDQQKRAEKVGEILTDDFMKRAAEMRQRRTAATVAQ